MMAAQVETLRFRISFVTYLCITKHFGRLASYPILLHALL